MKRTLHAQQTNAQQTLSVIWTFLTTLFLLVALYYQWQHYQLQKQNQLQLIAHQAGTKVDNFIENLLHSAYSLPMYGREFKNCQHDLLPLLQKMTFNNPLISGIVISDEQNKIICSTLGEKYPLPAPSPQSPFLFGPMSLGDESKAVFLLQQQLGQYYLGIYIIKNVIENLLRTVSSEISFIGLYNTTQDKIILQIGHDPLSDSTNLNFKNFAKAQLQNLDNITIIIAADPAKFSKNFIYFQLAIIVAILIIFFLSYLKLRGILNRRFSLKNALSNAIKLNSFQPAYQPVMDSSQNKYCGAEVLLRWRTDSNPIMPDVFIEEAEQSGLIVPITLQLVETAFEECQHLLKNHPTFYLAFNVSASHFNDRQFFSKFYNLCHKYKIPANQVMIELTERELLDQNDPQLIAKMHELRSKGHSLAIDDFGTGHASIKYLQHFPFNYLKIDKIFIHAIGTGAITETLSKAIIQMANQLELKIVAEGVETAEQVNFLQQQRVNFIQGWYFEKAVSHKELIKIINKGLG